MRRGSTVGGGRLAAFLMALLIVAVPLAAQWTHTPPPIESTYWWTLTDAVTPAQLRAALQDRDANRHRFRRAAGKGLHGETVTEQQVHEVVSYLNGAIHPELIPFYVAFEAYAARFEIGPDWREANSTLLTQHGMTREGIEYLRRVVTAYAARRAAIQREVAAPATELLETLRPLVPEVEALRIDQLLVEGDVRELARLSGRDVAWVAKRHAAWRREPIVEAGLPALEQLRADLTPADWEAFRRFLLREIAPQISGADTRED